MSQTAPDPDEDADDDIHPAIVSAEQDIERLEELTAIGMRVARRIFPMSEDKAAALALKGEAAPELMAVAEMAQVLTAVSRSIRLTINLKARRYEELRVLKAAVGEEQEEERTRAAQQANLDEMNAAEEAREAKRHRVRELAIEAAEREIENPIQADNFILWLDAYIREELLSNYSMAQPTREILRRVCNAAHLKKVDWTRWDGEGWIKEASPNATSAAPPAEEASVDGYGAGDDGLPTARLADNRPLAPPRLE